MTARFALLLALAACASSPAPAPPATVGTTAAPASTAWSPSAPTKTTGCVARGQLPDPACTPGAVMTRDLAVICGQSTRARRHVPAAVHRAIFAAYGASYPAPAGSVEVDHLIPLALGGSNDPANLWLEPAPGFHDKDRVENALRREVCAGRMRLEDAQRAMAVDWTAAARSLSVTMTSDGNADADDAPEASTP